MNKKIIEIISSDADSVLKNNKSFCAAPWIHTHIWPDGRVFPCCMAEYSAVIGNLNQKSSFTEIWNNDNYKNLRKDMLEGKPRPDVCSRCYEQEKHSINTLRENITKDFWNETKQQLKNTKDDYTVDLRLPYWDYRFNNICNLSCRTCGPDLSSSWYQDHIGLYGTVPKYATTKFVTFDPCNTESVYKELIEDQIEHVKEMYFAGGEPILMPEHQNIIERLIEKNKTDIKLRYSTNLSVLSYKGYNFLEKWPKFKEILIMISLDEIGERAEYWRNGTNWKKLETNIKKVIDLSKTYPNVKVGFCPTISVFNIHRMDVYVEYLLSNLLLDEHTPFVYNILQGPMEYNIKTLPEKYKDRARESLDKLQKIVLDWKKHMPGIKSMRSILDDQCDNVLRHQTYAADQFAKIDKLRSQSLKEIAPDIYEIYKDFGYDIFHNNFQITSVSNK